MHGFDLAKRAMLARLESHPLAAGKNDFDFICAVRGANSARLFVLLYHIIPSPGNGESRMNALGVKKFFKTWEKTA